MVIEKDEIKRHIEGRYVCPQEALRRINQFVMVKQSYAVVLEAFLTTKQRVEQEVERIRLLTEACIEELIDCEEESENAESSDEDIDQTINNNY